MKRKRKGTLESRISELEQRHGAEEPEYVFRLCDHYPEPGTDCAICPPLAPGGLRVTLDLGTQLGTDGHGVTHSRPPARHEEGAE